MSENEKEQFWAKIKPSFERYYDFVYSNYAADSSLAPQLYTCVSKLKGLLYSSSNKTRSYLQNHSDSLTQKKYTDWVHLKERLVYLYSVAEPDIEEVNSIETLTQDLEREFAKLLQNSGAGNTSTHWTADSTALSLNDNDVALELVRIPHEDGDSTYPVYMSLIIHPDSAQSISVATLDAGLTDGKYYQYYKNSIKYHIEDQKSFDHLWAWVDTCIHGYSTVFLSVDGVFNKININTLATGDNEYYLDRMIVIPISKTSSIHKMKKKTHANNLETAELFGFPHYGDQGLISSLPGTLKEVNKIDNILQEQSIDIHKNTGDNACEETVKSIRQPSILHLATHGFFLEPTASTNEKKIGDNLTKASENPLLLSGLYFCNAENADNKVIGTGDANSDGILTSYEAMSLDLSETELVVLSACETGVGTIRNGEGVYGLQRAFQVAGANSVIMSLWKVDDKATQELMTMFYHKWTHHESKIEAFRASVLEMRKKYDHPYYWGAFMMLGE
jgi:CHAT domain-containing protein